MCAMAQFAVLETRKIKALVPLFLEWYAANARDLPWRHTKDPYLIAVSEIMLQQTQVKTVIPFWKRWRRELPTIEAAAKAPSEKFTSSGKVSATTPASATYRKRRKSSSKNMAGNFRRSLTTVLALPGIGRYTAGAICSIAFNQPTPILDGNVIRVLTRIFGIAENPKEKATNARLWKLAEELVGRARTRRGQGEIFFATFAVFARNKSLLPSQSIADGTWRAGLHATQSAMLICPIKRLLRRVQGKPRGRNCPTLTNTKPPRRGALSRSWSNTMENFWSASGRPAW